MNVSYDCAGSATVFVTGGLSATAFGCAGRRGDPGALRPQRSFPSTLLRELRGSSRGTGHHTTRPGKVAMSERSAVAPLQPDHSFAVLWRDSLLVRTGLPSRSSPRRCLRLAPLAQDSIRLGHSGVACHERG